MTRVNTVLIVVALLAASDPLAAAHLRWSSAGDISTQDPHADNNSFNNNQVNQVYEQLTQRGKDYRITPWLATSWENVSPTKWIVKLRQDVKFTDGSRFTADDVVFSYDRARLSDSTFKLYANQAGIAKKIDDYTVEFTTAVPNPIFNESLNNIYIMSKAWAEKNNCVKPQDFRGKEETYCSRYAMGTGPYTLVSYEPGVKTTYKKNPDWWGITAGHFTGNVDTVEYRPIANQATRMAALRSGEIDFVLDPAVQDIPSLKEDRSLKVWEGKEIRVIFFAFDTDRPELLYSDVKGRNPFKDVRVRKALYQAIDIQAIKTQVMRGMSIPTGITHFEPVLGGVDTALEKRLPHDPAAAKKLLADAGYPNGFGFTLNCPNNRYINDEKICTAVAAMWAKIGINARLETLPRAQYFQKLGKFDTSAYMLGWGGGSTDAIYILKPVLHSRNTEGAGDSNHGNTKSERLDQLIDALEGEMDLKKRAKMIDASMKVVQDEVLTIPLHRQMIPWVSRANVSVIHRPSNFLTPMWVTIR